MRLARKFAVVRWPKNSQPFADPKKRSRSLARRSAAGRWPEEAQPFAGPEICCRALARKSLPYAGPRSAADRWPEEAQPAAGLKKRRRSPAHNSQPFAGPTIRSCALALKFAVVRRPEETQPIAGPKKRSRLRRLYQYYSMPTKQFPLYYHLGQNLKRKSLPPIVFKMSPSKYSDHLEKKILPTNPPSKVMGIAKIFSARFARRFCVICDAKTIFRPKQSPSKYLRHLEKEVVWHSSVFKTIFFQNYFQVFILWPS